MERNLNKAFNTNRRNENEDEFMAYGTDDCTGIKCGADVNECLRHSDGGNNSKWSSASELCSNSIVWLNSNY